MVTYHQIANLERRFLANTDREMIEHLEKGSIEFERDGHTITCKWLDADGKLHREDGPALESAARTVVRPKWQQSWYRHGVLHRDGSPASIDYREETWYQNGVIHRVGGPATIDKNLGEGVFQRKWIQNGEFKREDDKHTQEDRDGKRWYNSDCVLHRENGPAFVGHDGSWEWRYQGYYHRLDGPALMISGKEKYFIHGKVCRTREIHARRVLELEARKRDRLAPVSEEPVAMVFVP